MFNFENVAYLIIVANNVYEFTNNLKVTDLDSCIHIKTIFCVELGMDELK